MKRWVIGKKEDIEDVEYQGHKFHGGMESNYKCEFWAVIIKAEMGDSFAIRMHDLALAAITLPAGVTVKDNLPGNFYPNDMDKDIMPYKHTSDRRYFADRAINENDLIIDRESDGKPKP